MSISTLLLVLLAVIAGAIVGPAGWSKIEDNLELKYGRPWGIPIRRLAMAVGASTFVFGIVVLVVGLIVHVSILYQNVGTVLMYMGMFLYSFGFAAGFDKTRQG